MINEKKRLLILSFSNIAWDSRVLREIEFAAPHYQVDVIGFGDWPGKPGVRFFPLAKTPRTRGYMAGYLAALLAGRLSPAVYERFFWSKGEYGMAREIIRREKYDLIHANDWDALPVAVSAARQTGSRVLFDAHEYTVEQEADRPFWKATVAPLRDYFLRSYQECVTARVTVAEGIRDLYRQNYGWDMDLILNAPAYTPAQFRPVQPGQIHILHHGGAIPSRYLEDFVDLGGALDERFTLSLMLMPTNRSYYEMLCRRAAGKPGSRVQFLDPVPVSKMFEVLPRFDLGIPAMRVRQLNNFYCLPNKFFEFVMAGLGVVVTPLPSMQKIIEQHGIGAVSADQSWQSVARCLNGLSGEEINGFKQNALAFARQVNAGSEGEKLLQIYQKALE